MARSGRPAPARRRVGFLAHEVAEYVLAAALLAVGIHASGATQLTLVAAGAALLVLNVATDGKLGAFPLFGRRAHHVADAVVLLGLALSPLLAFRQLHLLGTVVAEAVALVLLRMERSTLYRPGPAPAPPGASASGRPSPASPARPVGVTGQRPAPSGPASAGTVPRPSAAAVAGALAPVAGRAAGRAARSGARRLGLVAGVARRVAREHAADRRAGGTGSRG